VTALAVAGAVVAPLMLLGMVGLHVRVERLERFLQLQARFNEAQLEIDHELLVTRDRRLRPHRRLRGPLPQAWLERSDAG